MNTIRDSHSTITKPTPFEKKKGGFSTLDILIGISLAIILTAILVVSNSTSAPRAKSARNIDSLLTLQNATDRFIMEYGSLPQTTFGDGTSGKIMSTGERIALIQAISGQFNGADTALAIYSASHGTFSLKTDAATMATRFSAIVIPVSPAPLGKIVILQYQDNPRDGVVTNANKSTSKSFFPADTTLTGPDIFDPSANPAWTSISSGSAPQ